MSSESLVFEEDGLQEIEVIIRKKKYILREADGDAVIAYRNALSERVVVVNGNPTVKAGVGDVPVILLQHCLFETSESGVLTKIKPMTLRGFKSTTIDELYRRVKSMSSLDVEEVTEESITKEIQRLNALKEQLATEKERLGN